MVGNTRAGNALAENARVGNTLALECKRLGTQGLGAHGGIPPGWH